MSTIDDIGYLPHRLPTPEKNERYVLKGPTKSPPPIFMPKPIHAVAPTQKLVQEQLQLQQQQEKQSQKEDHYSSFSSPVLVNSPKPMSATITTTTTSVDSAAKTSSNGQPRTPQQKHAVASSSRQTQPQSTSIKMPTNRVTFDTPDVPIQQPFPQKKPKQQQQQQQQQHSISGLSAEYHEIVRQNEILRERVLMLTQQQRKMERECHAMTDRLVKVERQLRRLGYLQPCVSGGGCEDEGDGFSDISVPVSPMHSRSAPTTTTTMTMAEARTAMPRGYTRRLGRASGENPSVQYHRHHHRRRRSRSAPREDVDAYPNRLRRPRSYDNFYGDSERDNAYYSYDEEGDSHDEAEADEQDNASVVENDDQEDWVEDGYLRQSRQGRGLRQPAPPHSRSRSTRLVHPPVAATLPHMDRPVTSRRPPPMRPGRYPIPIVPSAPSVTGMRGLRIPMGAATGRDPEHRSLRHRHSSSLYRLAPQQSAGTGAAPPRPSHCQGEYDEDYLYESYDDDDAGYPQPHYQRSSLVNGGGGNWPRYI